MSPLIKKLKWRTKILLIMITSVLIIGLIGMVVINNMRHNILHKQITELSDSFILLLTNQIKHNMEYHVADHFQNLMEEMKISGTLWSVKVLDNQYKVVFSNDPQFVGQIKKLPAEAEALDQSLENYYWSVEKDSFPILNVLSPIPNEPGCYHCHGSESSINGYLELEIDNSKEMEVDKLLLRYDIISLSTFLIILILIVFTVHNRFFQIPFSQIKEGIQSIHEGHLDTRIEISTSGELRSLAENINDMAQNLEESQREIEKLYRGKIERAGQLATVGELAASVAHEIKNPIAGIKGALEIILDQNKDIKEKEIFYEMFSQIQRMIKTIDDLMAYAKPQEPQYVALDIHNILSQAISLHRKQLKAENIKLIERFSTECPMVEGDDELLKQVFANLLINSFQACKDNPDSTIEISTKYNPERKIVEIVIEDNGLGIAPEALGKIFKPFYTTKHKGSGLGLSLSKSIIIKHGGDIHAQSEYGKWTKFTVALPIKYLTPDKERK